MAETNRVVVHFTDGRLLKGTTIDFNIMQPKFHVSPGGTGPTVEVLCSNMKALFFVKSLEGRPRPAPAQRGFDAPRSLNAQGKKVAILFKDGELLCGYTLTFVPGRNGFFMFPADADTNNLRVYVVNASTAEVRTGAEADALAQRVLSSKGRALAKA